MLNKSLFFIVVFFSSTRVAESWLRNCAVTHWLGKNMLHNMGNPLSEQKEASNTHSLMCMESNLHRQPEALPIALFRHQHSIHRSHPRSPRTSDPNIENVPHEKHPSFRASHVIRSLYWGSQLLGYFAGYAVCCDALLGVCVICAIHVSVVAI